MGAAMSETKKTQAGGSGSILPGGEPGRDRFHSITAGGDSASIPAGDAGAAVSVNLQIFGRLSEEQQAALLAQAARERVNGNGPGRGDDAAGDAGPAWVIRTLADAYAPRPPISYLVEKFLPEGCLAMFFGTPGGFKSMLLADLAVCVAGGARWLPLPDGSGGRATKAAPVFWVDCDNGRRRTDARFEALAKARRLAGDAPLFYVSMPHPALDLTDPESFFLLADHVRRHQVKLVILDNLGLISGDVEENSSAMAGVMGSLRRLAEDAGAAVVIIHHQRKTADKDQAINVIRGHSSISASLDLAVHVGRDVAESVTGAMLIPVKMRDSDIPIMAADFAYEHLPGTDGELSEARFFGRRLVDTGSKQAIRRAVLTALFDGRPVNQSDLVAAVKDAGITAGVNIIRQEIDYLVAAGDVTETRGKHNAKLFCIT